MEEEIKKEVSSRKEAPKKKMAVSKSIIIAGIFLLLVAGSYFYAQSKKGILGQDAIKAKVENYVKDNLIQPGTDFKITKIEKQGSLYKFTFSVGTQEIIAYATNDGKNFFPQAINMDEKKDSVASSNSSVATEASVKKAIPDVELFVMSQCPYGIQAEKGLLPVIQKLGSKINFKLEFVDYILHGKKEFDENLNQYCIQKEEAGKLDNYLNCYTVSGDSAKCLAQANINKSKITSCVSETDKNFGLTQKFNSGGSNPPFELNKDTNDKYGVKGSPTLVVNGTTIDAGRDSASMLKAICSGFNNPPAECSATLSSTSPSAGFGEGTAAASSSPASCH
ncbi:MAG: hypothetical protein V1804_01625 [Patescibacteria group bacterium]